MKRDIDLKTENVKKMGKQVSVTLKGYTNNTYIIYLTFIQYNSFNFFKS